MTAVKGNQKILLTDLVLMLVLLLVMILMLIYCETIGVVSYYIIVLDIYLCTRYYSTIKSSSLIK